MQVGKHACRGLVGDLDGRLEDTLRNDVRLGGSWRLGTHKQPEVLVTWDGIFFNQFLQASQPLGDKMDVLVGEKVETKCKDLFKWRYLIQDAIVENGNIQIL